MKTEENLVLKRLKENITTYCVDLVKKEPGMVEWLKGENETPESREQTIRRFLDSREGMVWLDYKINIYYRIQSQLGVDMGLCHYFEISTSKKKAAGYCKDLDDVTSCQGTILFCRHLRPEQ